MFVVKHLVGETLDDDEICLDSLLLMRFHFQGCFCLFQKGFFWVNCCVITKTGLLVVIKRNF